MSAGQSNTIKVWEQLKPILGPEKPFYIVATIYGAGVGLLTLAIPISVQALVNNVSFGVVLQPLVVLSIVLLALLIFSGTLKALQTYVIELFQRHFFARVGVDVTARLLNADYKELEKRNGIELVNRYFDIMTVQKKMASLLVGGVAMVLQTGVGFLLLAFYHPYFLIFDILLFGMLWAVWSLYSKDALESAIVESKTKYKFAHWLQEIARNNLFFKTENRKELALRFADNHIEDYLDKRTSHFKTLFRQQILLLIIYAFMSAVVLGLGGFLVIQGQLSIGQLVAAELVIAVILSGLSKGGKYLEAFYDLFAAADKISHFYDFKLMDYKAGPLKSEVLNNWDLNLEKVELKPSDTTFSFDYSFKASKNYIVKALSHSAKLVFLDLIQGLVPFDKGKIELGDENLEELSPFYIKSLIYILDVPRVFQGTIYENLTIDCKMAQKSDVRKALDLVDLGDLESIFEDGLDTTIFPSGYPLWPSQLIRLEFARMILAKPKIIILTEVLDHMTEVRTQKILEYFTKSDATVIYCSQFAEKRKGFDFYLELDKDKIKEEVI